MLDQKTCVPCKGGIPPLTLADATQLLSETPKWALIDDDQKIRRNFAFNNFVDALAFVNKVANLCEEEGHHADLQFGWGYATIIYYSHKIGGLHENDFIMAAKTDKLYNP